MRFLNTGKRFFRPPVGKNNENVREQWLQTVLQKIPPGCRILDAGAGTQRYKTFCRHLRYVAQDFGEYNGEGDAAGLQIEGFDYVRLDIISDITAIPEPDASYGAVMCIEVLEHLPEPQLAIKEFTRLLEPGGWLILTAPFCSLTHFAPYHFSSGFNKYWYKHHLERNGFEILELKENGNYFEFLAQEIGRINSLAKRYTGSRVGLLRRLALWTTLRMLDKFSRRDAGSSELLCYGYHVLAKRLPVL